MRRRLRALVLLAALPALGAAQEAGPGTPRAGTSVDGEVPQGADFADQVSVGYVLVPVSVRSRAGFVTDLGPDDFALEVDGRRVDFDSFERGGEAPVSLAFLQDLSGSMALGGKLDQSQGLVECLLEKSSPSDRFALATFAGRQVSVEVPFGADRAPLLEVAAGWRAYGVTALHDAVARIPELAASREHPNVVAVLITDGVENASDLTSDQAREVVRQARIPVYVLGFEGAAGGAPSEDAAEQYSGVLRRLAAFTGGRYFALATPQDAREACVQISIELRSRYVLGFATADGEPAAYREMRVNVERSGLWIAHRRGYTGPPPAALWQDADRPGGH
jgi:VWFA-related protein